MVDPPSVDTWADEFWGHVIEAEGKVVVEAGCPESMCAKRSAAAHFALRMLLDPKGKPVVNYFGAFPSFVEHDASDAKYWDWAAHYIFRWIK